MDTQKPLVPVVIFSAKDLSDETAMQKALTQLSAHPDRSLAFYLTDEHFEDLPEEAEARAVVLKTVYEDRLLHCGLRFNSESKDVSCTERAFTGFNLTDELRGCAEISYAVTAPSIGSAVYAVVSFHQMLYQGEYKLPEHWRGEPYEAVLQPPSNEHPYREVQNTWTMVVGVPEMAQAEIKLILSGSALTEDEARTAHAKVIDLYNAGQLAEKLTNTTWFV